MLDFFQGLGSVQPNWDCQEMAKTYQKSEASIIPFFWRTSLLLLLLVFQFSTSQIPRLPWQWVGEPAWFTTCFSESSSHWPTAALSLRGTLWYNTINVLCILYLHVLYCIVYLIQICSHLGRRKLSTSLLAKTSTVGSATTSIMIKCLIWSSLEIHLESPKSANRELFVKVASFGKLPVIKWYDDD